MLYLTSDHRGFAIKEQIKNYLKKKDIKFVDLGPFVENPTDDYPLFAVKLGEAVVANKGRGIALCRSGVGMAIALNKVDGVKAGESYTVEEARLSRQDDDTNVLVLSAEEFGDEKGFAIIDTWLNTPFSGAERHIRRLNEIEEYEETH